MKIKIEIDIDLDAVERVATLPASDNDRKALICKVIDEASYAYCPSDFAKYRIGRELYEGIRSIVIIDGK